MAVVHTPLHNDKNQIRLIHISPAAHDGDTIRCRFTVASLDHRPHYEALSYVWGDSTRAHSIRVDDRFMPVTDNLYAALRRLRLRDKDLTLWVDALCINQSNLNEKMHQVSRMSEIYKQASQVIIWLDEGWDGSDLAMEFLRVIGDDASLHLHPSLNPHVTVEGLTLESIELRGHLIRIFNRPWWTRTWTIQEFVLAQKPVFQCGESRVTGKIMYMARENFWSHKDRCCPSTLLNDRHPEHGMNLMGAFEVPARLDFISKSRGNSYSVLTPITTFCKRGVTNPRDRVYGMLGLGTGPYADLVKPDYALTPEQVCETVALKSIERTGKFEFLSHLFEHQNPNLPSFIPNWTGYFEWYDIYGLWLGNVKSFQASGDTKAQYKLISRGMLAAQGVIFDSITATCPASLVDNFMEPNYVPELLEFTCPEGSFQEPYIHTNEPRLLAFWHTLNGGMQMILEDSNRYSRRLKGSTDLSKCLKFVEFMTSRPRAEPWDTEIDHILLDVETGTRGRKMFTTRSGCFGLAPQKCQEGDMVVVLLGGDMPYIVRPAPPQKSKKCFTILGDSYVHGIMDGEVYVAQNGSTREVEEIVLI